MKQLFPKEIIEHTVEVHQFTHTSKSKIIYGTILFTVVVVLLGLPFIKINIYTTAKGMLKPSKERIMITPLQSGKVIFAVIQDNQKVAKGDTLLMTSTIAIDAQIQRSTLQTQEINTFITDCKYLSTTMYPKLHQVRSAKYKKETLYFYQKLRILKNRVQKTKNDYLRNKKLYQKGVIAKVEYENTLFEYQLASSNVSQYKKEQKNNWQAALTDYNTTLREQKSNLSQLQQSQKEQMIIAPIDGILKNVTGIAPGSFITAGTKLAEISPDTRLVAECYLSPSDIGLISKNKTVNFQVDAFNYNQWGLATGQILEISKDIDMIDNQPVFKVKCQVDQNFLQLKNGFKGNFNKGMTLNARFQLTERTLYDLLYDKVDDWLNPSSPNRDEVVSR
ncbi:HlyD family secretion protein [Aquimarina algicola]|uniref:HlyD family efflux transporter periplasmic adaptor subunit n=1 Tax=Aquimarina algicola TaxID=2589995 RepID=A0A504JAN2_9FLAO|nr:HlyD family efflux transporter periplasmic adaptor subunit [Aquimarina algicola]TPN87967.1 HlyD family efflux transporter periplasmic adaptor subunit [Aquimarina algicola]